MYEKGNEIKVTVIMIGEIEYTGLVNIINFTRFSDFIENYSEKHIKLYDAKSEKKSISGVRQFIMLNKKNVIGYKPYNDMG